MANQPTKYRKFVVGAASAALVASAVAPVASAATFTDIQGNTHEEAINALVDAGVINGYEDGTFKPNKTLTRSDVVKLMGKLLIAEGYEAPADYKTKPRFSDLKTTSNDELLKMSAVVYDNGVFVGKPDGSLDANGDITRENMAIVLVRAFDRIYDVDLVDYVKAQDFKKDVTDLGKAKAEARPAIDVLDFFDITNPAAPEFNPKNTTTRGQFASLLYKTTQVDFDKIGGGTVAPGVAAVTAINATTVAVTFKDAVKNIDSLKFTIDGLTVSNAAVKQDDDKTVILTTAVQEGGKKYTVTLDGEAVGTFTGVSATVPTTIKVTNPSVQGKTGQQAIISADIGVKQAGVPVTFNVKVQNAPTLNKDQVFEAVTNEDGIATFSYTQYADGKDEVVAYPTGNPTVRSLGYVFWGVDTALTIEDVTVGNTISNGANKAYKVTYKNPKTGKVEANKTFNVSLEENLDVTADKLSSATVNGVKVSQLVNDKNPTVAVITTDSKGEATFTVTGSNTKATPVVFEQNTGTTAADRAKYETNLLQAKASTVTFAAQQAEYAIELTRDGGEIAARGVDNGRKYKVVVKNKDGNVAANETVNVAFNEDLDRVISTNTNAYFIKVNDDKTQVKNGRQVSVKTDSKGEATFVIGSDVENDYATPIAWIDVNSPNAKNGVLDEGEPFTIASISYFKAAYLDGASLKVYNGTKETSDFKGNETAVFKTSLVNQSGKSPVPGTSIKKVSYTIFNEGANEVQVGGQVISPNRSYTVTYDAPNTDLNVVAVDSKSSAVRVIATGTAVDTDGKDFTFTAKEATAKFSSTNEVGNLYTGVVASYNTDKDELTFDGKEAVKFKGESGKKYEYFLNASPITEERFEDELKVLGSVNNKVSREVTGDTVKFFIIEKGTGAAIKDIGKDKIAADKAIDAINLIPALDRLVAGDKATIDKARAEYDKLTADQKKLVPVAVYEKLVNSEKKIGEIVNAVPNLYSGEIVSYNTIDKTITFDGKTPVKYEGETGVSYRFFDELNRPLANSTDFFAALKKGNRVSREVVGNTVDFRIFANGTGAAVENAANNVEAAKKVTDAINALPTVANLKLADKAAVDQARADYDVLTADQKALVTAATLKTLTDAEAKIAELVAGDADAQAAKKVEDAIKALPAAADLELTDKAAVDQARADYDALTADQKALVPAAAVSTLEAAEAKITELEEAQPKEYEFTDLTVEATDLNLLGLFNYKIEGTVAGTKAADVDKVIISFDPAVNDQDAKTFDKATGKFTYTEGVSKFETITLKAVDAAGNTVYTQAVPVTFK